MSSSYDVDHQAKQFSQQQNIEKTSSGTTTNSHVQNAIETDSHESNSHTLSSPNEEHERRMEKAQKSLDKPSPSTSPPEEGFGGGIQLCITKSEGGYIYIEFPEGDPQNPINWSLTKKVFTLICTFLFAGSTAINGTGFNSMQESVKEEFQISTTVFLLGNLLYLSIGVAFTPLLLAPLSEIFGRQPIFMSSAAIFGLLYIPAALTPTFTGFLIVRFLQGCLASVGNSMVGGTVSDIFPSKKRGLPMSLFALSIYFGQAIGPLTVSYTIANPKLGWRWVFAWQGFIGALVFILMAIFLRETRGPVLLSRRARSLTKNDPQHRQYKCSADDDRVGFWQAVKISLSRPAWWLISEPIVTSFSLWIGFLWGCIFLLLESVPIVFDVYGWTEPQKSLVLLCLAVGGFFAWLCTFHQEKLYARAVAKAAPQKVAPEARLYYACVGGVIAPIGFFIFAWTGRADIHPAAPIFGLVLFSGASFWIYLAVFTYIAECYEIYASSGLAAQSWLRNVLAGAFPLFATGMYDNLTPPIASTVLGVIAAVLGICPFMLFFFGGKIRSKSRVAKALAAEEEQRMIKMQHERERNEKRAARQRNTQGDIEKA